MTASLHWWRIWATAFFLQYEAETQTTQSTLALLVKRLLCRNPFYNWDWRTRYDSVWLSIQVCGTNSTGHITIALLFQKSSPHTLLLIWKPPPTPAVDHTPIDRSTLLSFHPTNILPYNRQCRWVQSCNRPKTQLHHESNFQILHYTRFFLFFFGFDFCWTEV